MLLAKRVALLLSRVCIVARSLKEGNKLQRYRECAMTICNLPEQRNWYRFSLFFLRERDTLDEFYANHWHDFQGSIECVFDVFFSFYFSIALTMLRSSHFTMDLLLRQFRGERAWCCNKSRLGMIRIPLRWCLVVALSPSRSSRLDGLSCIRKVPRRHSQAEDWIFLTENKLCREPEHDFDKHQTNIPSFWVNSNFLQSRRCWLAALLEG